MRLYNVNTKYCFSKTVYFEISIDVQEVAKEDKESREAPPLCPSPRLPQGLRLT